MAESIVLVNLSGADSSVVTTAVLAELALVDARVLDIGQAVLHGELNLALLLQAPARSDPQILIAELTKALSAAVAGQRVHLQIAAVSAQRYAYWLSEQTSPRHIVTLLAKRITTAQLGKVAAIVAHHGLRINRVTRLSGRAVLAITADDPQRAAEESSAIVELELRGVLHDQPALRRALMAIAHTDAVDVAIQADDVYRRNRRLVAFDMDSTLIQGEVIDELAAAHGVGEAVAAITAAAMRGELDFTQSFRRRVALLAGASVELLEQVAASIALSDGAERLVRTLKQIGRASCRERV